MFARMEQLGAEGQQAAAFLRARRTKVGFKKARRSVGGFWALGKSIYLNSYYYSYENTLHDLRAVTLLVHEVRHLQQGFWTALSVYGELDAWQLEFRIYHKVRKRYPHPAIEEIMSLPPGWNREVLRRAVHLMQDYAGKGYRADLLPLYPLDKEIKYRLFKKQPV
ncbi:MAG: hypothetical protein Kow002_05310 [Anaerolineales bacterium]